MPWLLVSKNLKSEDVFSIMYFDKHRGEYRPTGEIYVEITDEQSKLSIPELAAWYKETRGASEEQRKAAEAHRLKGEAMLERLGEIIRTSHHEGERENAKALYLKYAGKPYQEKKS